jgi:hypothetical protein
MVQDQEASATFISDVMQLTRRCKAYDPRDMVYGVLGLLRMKGDQTIVPDYTKTPTEVCVEVGRRCFFHSRNTPSHEPASASILQRAHSRPGVLTTAGHGL